MKIKKSASSKNIYKYNIFSICLEGLYHYNYNEYMKTMCIDVLFIWFQRLTISIRSTCLQRKTLHIT